MPGNLIEHAWIFWLALGGLLLAAEMLGASGYLLWSGCAAVITGLLTWILPFDWAWQGVCFALLTVITAFLWWLWLSFQKQQKPPQILNQRAQQLIGHRFHLQNALINGRGHIRVGDSSWPVIAESDIPANTVVVIIAVEGIVLRIQAI